jgi:nicotinate-nucleotide adenylyltransferase
MQPVNMLGYLGGSFDPPHAGHLQLAQHALTALKLDKVFLLPCYQHAFNKSLSGIEHRLNMLKLLIADQDKIAIDLREAKQPGISYTLNTLQKIKQDSPGDHATIVFMIGYDVLLSLNQWERWQELFNYCHLGVFQRRGYNEQPLPAWLQQLLQKRETQHPQQLQESTHGKIFIFKQHIDAISATHIRHQLMQHQSPKPNHIPASIVQYALQHKLYANQHDT